MKPYEPNLINIPASNTEPATGASTWACGNQIWKGNLGILTANDAKKHKKMGYCTLVSNLIFNNAK
jgi:hypothetical protein